MNLIHTLLAFIVAMGTLVIVHELGHFLVARWCGVKVLRCSVGMGPVIYSRQFGKDGTEWALPILPPGGYVKMLDAREQDLSGLSAQERRREFTGQSVWRCIAIVAAGPVANFILAILLFTRLYLHGMHEPVPKLRAAPPESIAYQAGVRPKTDCRDRRSAGQRLVGPALAFAAAGARQENRSHRRFYAAPRNAERVSARHHQSAAQRLVSQRHGKRSFESWASIWRVLRRC